MDLEDLIRDEQFLNKISASVRNIICAHFPHTSASEREDIDQEVKLKLLKMAARGKGIRNLRSYLWRVVYTTTLDVIGKRLEQLPAGNDDGEAPWLVAGRLDFVSPERLAEQGELKRMLERAIESLPERRRLVVRLHLTGMGLEESAEFLGWSQNKVRHLLYRGLAELRGEFMGGDGAGRSRDAAGTKAMGLGKRLVLKESDE
jgi:RNA polymerase sigma-70 factor, ECF subfamily